MLPDPSLLDIGRFLRRSTTNAYCPSTNPIATKNLSSSKKNLSNGNITRAKSIKNCFTGLGKVLQSKSAREFLCPSEPRMPSGGRQVQRPQQVLRPRQVLRHPQHLLLKQLLNKCCIPKNYKLLANKGFIKKIGCIISF